MSRARSLVSAVHPVGYVESMREFWKEDVIPFVDSYEIEDLDCYSEDEKYRYAKAVYDGHDIRVYYHSDRDQNVLEMELADLNEDGGLYRPEKVLSKINFDFDIDFHLEVYRYYNGVDRTGAYNGQEETEGEKTSIVSEESLSDGEQEELKLVEDITGTLSQREKAIFKLTKKFTEMEGVGDND